MSTMENNSKNLSIIMTVYNGEKYVSQTIESILSQSYNSFEFIIIDDASTDNTYQICEKYSLQDNRIRLYKNKQNLWVVKTRNVLLDKISSDSKYIAIIDADDIAYPERMRKQIDFLEANSYISIIWSDIDIIDENGKSIGERIYPHTHEDISKTIFQKSPLAQPAVMIRKSDFDKVGKYNDDFERCQDYELWCRFFDQGYKIANLPEKLIAYRVYPDQWKTRHLKLSLRNTIKVQKKYIFQKQYFSFQNLFYFLAENILAFFPNSFILWIFKKITY